MPFERSYNLPLRMICGIVLCAGRSRRMGEPKALLDAGGASFLRRTVEALAGGGCGRVVAVVGPDAEAIAAEARAAGAEVVVNRDPEAEQVDSLRAGLRALGTDADAAIVSPVDVPDVGAPLVRRLADAFRATAAPVVVPAAEGGHGHPVLFARAVFGELLDGALLDGARTVVRRHVAALVEVPVERLLPDLDTPADYRRWREGAWTER